MAQNSGAKRTGGANGPRADKAKAITGSVIGDTQPEHDDLHDTFDESEGDLDNAGYGLEQAFGGNDPLTQPQESRGFGAALDSVHGYHDKRANPPANDEANASPYPDRDYGTDFHEEAKHLRAPAPMEGFVQCWINWFTPDGMIDRYVPAMMRRGWVPRPVNTVPSREMNFYDKRKNHDGEEMIVSAGMVLCHMPEERMRQIEASEKRTHQRFEAATVDEIRSANREAYDRGAGMQIAMTNRDI